MRHCLPVIVGLALIPAALNELCAQQRGITTAQTQELTAALEMGHPDSLSSHTFEQADDPTIAAHPVPPHDPTPAARKAAQKAERFAKKKKHDEAAAGYREAVAADPRYFEAWNNLALELDAAGKREEAIDTLRQATTLAPEHVLGFVNLVGLLCQEHRYADAEAVARLALKSHNYSFKANYMLGAVLVQQGKWTGEAKTKLEYAQVKYPGARTLLDKWPVQAQRGGQLAPP